MLAGRAVCWFVLLLLAPFRERARPQRRCLQGVNGSPEHDNILKWKAVVFGPEGTCWDGATLRLSLEFSEEYPNKAPVVKFVSTMFHPNSELRSPGQLAVGWGNALRSRPHLAHTLRAHTYLCAVYADGGICLDILQNQWSPIYDVAAILTSIQVCAATGSVLSSAAPALTAA